MSVPILLAPLVMLLAASVERRLGPSAAGWVAALPIAFGVATVAVSLDGGPGVGAELALSAGSHVSAQVTFGVVAATILVRRGLVAGLVAGALAYLVGSVVLALIPVGVAIAAAVVALVAGPRLMPESPIRPSPRSSWTTTGLTCAAAGAIVAAAVLTSRMAGPALAGAVAAFPTMCLVLTVAVVVKSDRVAGVNALAGLVRSLPCYLTFCLVVALAEPSLGLLAVPLATAACVGVVCHTWRGVRIARPALVQ